MRALNEEELKNVSGGTDAAARITMVELLNNNGLYVIMERARKDAPWYMKVSIKKTMGFAIFDEATKVIFMSSSPINEGETRTGINPVTVPGTYRATYTATDGTTETTVFSATVQ